MESFYEKWKKLRKKMKKWQIENLKNLGKSVPSFRFCPTAFCPNFRDFRSFQVFDLAPPKPKNNNRLIFNMIMPWETNMNMKQKIYKYEGTRSFMMAEMWKSTLRNTYTQNSKIKTNQQKVKRRNLFYFLKCFIY